MGKPENELWGALGEKRSSGWVFEEEGSGEREASGVCLERSGEAFAAMLGVMRSGCVYVGLDPSDTEEEIERTLEMSGLEVIISARASN